MGSAFGQSALSQREKSFKSKKTKIERKKEEKQTKQNKKFNWKYRAMRKSDLW